MSDDEWLFYYAALSEHCPKADASIPVLKQKYTLPDFVTLLEVIEIRESLTTAAEKDAEAKNKMKQK